MPIIEKGLFDLIEDRIVSALETFRDEQIAIDPAVTFSIVQRQLRPFQGKKMPVVNVWLDGLNPEDGSRTYQQETVTYQVDCYAKGIEQTGATPVSSDKDAMDRLYYLAIQVKHGLYRLINADYGFQPGTIARKRWPRFSLFQTDTKMPEGQIVGGRWTVEVEYSWQPEDIATVALAELAVEDSLKERWKTLYTYP